MSRCATDARESPARPARYRTRRWSVGKSAVLIPHLLKRQFTVTRRNKACVTDTTYIRTRQGWLYLAVVMDLFSRKIVGWSAGPPLHRQLVLDAVLMAVRRRRPRGTHAAGGAAGDDYAGDASRDVEEERKSGEPGVRRAGHVYCFAFVASCSAVRAPDRIIDML